MESKPRIGAPIRDLGVRERRSARSRPPAELERDQTIEAKAEGGRNKIARPVSGVARFNRTILTKGHTHLNRNLAPMARRVKPPRCRRIQGAKSARQKRLRTRATTCERRRCDSSCSTAVSF